MMIFWGKTPEERRVERAAETRGSMRVMFQRAWIMAMRREEPAQVNRLIAGDEVLN